MQQDGIFPPFEAFYIESLLWHTTSAKQSIDVIYQWLDLVQSNDPRALHLSKPDIFEQLQNILHQAGCVSRYLFPSRKKPLHLDRAKRLQEALRVHDDSPLKDRELRDAIEHFDERLDVYLSSVNIGHFIPEIISNAPPQSEIPLHILKGFYTSPLVFVLLGRDHEMEPIVNEMLRIHNALLACTEKGYRLPYPE